ncbi:MAG: MBL fold metallo-hydrolase, partial [Pseudomonadota bacterium]
MTLTLSRRQALVAGAAAPAAGLAGAAFAEAEMQGASQSIYSRFVLGGFEVTTLLSGTATREEPQSIFALNVPEQRFKTVSEANFLPTDKAQFYFTPTVVNTGSELVLFDTGLNPRGIRRALEAAGYSAEQIDVVVITHMHGDHIGGLWGDAGETFTNARYMTNATEFDHWAGAGNDTFEAKMRPLADKFTFIGDGASVASGITSMVAAGHTPGHTTYMIESEGQSVLIVADLAAHYVYSLGYPDWEVRFDMDKAAAAATRRRVLDMLATDKVPFIGYHMPFPAVGYVGRRGQDGFRYVPMSYQMQVG